MQNPTHFMTDFRIAEKTVYNEHYFSLVLQHPERLPQMEPGQFVEVEVPDEKGVFLRRPISIHDVDPERATLSLLVQTVGKGTRRLSRLEPGATLNLVYPLGHGFTPVAGNVLLVGGGAGMAPLLFLARRLASQGAKPTVLLGGRIADRIPIRDRYEAWAHVGYATEDGSLGEKGLVTQHSLFALSYDHIYTCGPTPMMKAVARSARERGIDCELSLENLMACGLGACLCCVCDTDAGHRCVCKQGPVFRADELTRWLAQ